MSIRYRAVPKLGAYIVSLVIGLATGFTTPALALPPTTSGPLLQDETWSGAVILTGDVTVPPGIALIIEPGTRVHFSALSDDRSGGADNSRTELIVEGALIAEKATFTSSSIQSPSPGDWGGIRLTPAADDTAMSFNDCTIEYALNGITVTSDGRHHHLHIAASRIQHNADDGISITAINNADITIDIDSNRIADNGDRGIHGTIEGIQTILDGMVTANTVENNSAAGIFFTTSASQRAGLLIERNTILNNDSFGIYLHSRSDIGYFTISHNSISTSGTGIAFEALDGISDVILNDNHISNGSDGIFLLNRADRLLTTTIEDNRLVDNQGRGIYAAVDSDNADMAMDIRFNTITGNGNRGIELKRISPSPEAELRATISLNTIHGNAAEGLVCKAVHSADLFYNDIRSNDGGVYLDAIAMPKVHWNNLYGNNSQFGIYDLANRTSSHVDARFNYWGEAVTRELNEYGHPPQMVFYEVILHIDQDPALGRVYASDWLSGPVAFSTEPLLHILSPRHETTQKQRSVRIEGIAASANGIDRVELSFDDGQTWYPAQGGESWQLQWQFDRDGIITVGTRVTDNLGQISTILYNQVFFIDSSLPTTSGALTGNVTWQEDIVVTGDVVVPPGVTLTIMPGTVVRFQKHFDGQTGGSHAHQSELIISGSLEAHDVIFTSADETQPAPGDWQGIRFEPEPEEIHPQLILTGCTIAYAAEGIYADIHATDAEVELDGTTIAQSEYSGIVMHVDDSAMAHFRMLNSQVTASGLYGVSVECLGQNTHFDGAIEGSTISDNGITGLSFWFDDVVSPSLSITENTIQHNHQHGISIASGAYFSRCDILSNTISDNISGGIGFWLWSNDPGRITIRSNTIYNGGYGISLYDSASGALQLDIKANRLFNHNQHAIGLYTQSFDARIHATISSNQVYANSGNGIELGYIEPDDSLFRGDIDAELSLNSIHENGGYGLYLLTNDPIRIQYNQIYGNAGGIYLMSREDAVIHTNDIQDNGSGYALALANEPLFSLDARFNYWGSGPTAQMTSGSNPQNIDVIFDEFDDPGLARVDYSGWLDQSITTLDTDADTLTDRWEFANGTNPLESDTDGDLVDDNIEIRYGSDPTDQQSLPYTVYEDAQDELTTGWFVYTGQQASAVIENTFDTDRASRVIALSGSGVDHGYALFGNDGSEWNNGSEFIAEWHLKYTEPYVVYIEVQTSAGRRYLQYTPVDYSYLGSGTTIHHGVGSHTIDGSWHMLTRDLAADLHDAQPDVTLLAVNAFLIRGSGRVDDIKLTAYAADSDLDGLNDISETTIHGTNPLLADTDGDGLTDADEIEIHATSPTQPDSDGDGINDGDELARWGGNSGLDSDNDGLPNLLDADSDNDGIGDGSELAQGTDPADAASIPPTVYEDAQDLTTAGWFVYTGDPGSAVIANVQDAQPGNPAIELTGDGQIHGFALYGEDGRPWQNDTQFIIEWRLNFSEFFTVYVEVQTTQGRRYLQYTPVDYDNMGAGTLVHHGVGGHTTDGTWQRFIRNLAEDLSSVQPDASIQSVEGFLIRGSGRVDDIKLWSAVPDTDGDGLSDLEEIDLYGTRYDQPDTDEDGISDWLEVTTYQTVPTVSDTDADGIADGDELAIWTESGWQADGDGDGLCNLIDPDSDNDGASDGLEISLGYDPENSSDTPATVYEDAQDQQTARWDVYDGDSATASIDNEFDPLRASRVISLTGNSTIHGFRLSTASGSPWNNAGQFFLDLGIRFSAYYIIYVDLQTTKGQRYLKYTPSDYDDLGSGQYIHHGLGWHTRNGLWHDLSIDLQSDLLQAQPDAAILTVNGLLIRGSGKIDDVRLRN